MCHARICMAHFKTNFGFTANYKKQLVDLEERAQRRGRFKVEENDFISSPDSLMAFL